MLSRIKVSLRGCRGQVGPGDYHKYINWHLMSQLQSGRHRSPGLTPQVFKKTANWAQASHPFSLCSWPWLWLTAAILTPFHEGLYPALLVKVNPFPLKWLLPGLFVTEAGTETLPEWTSSLHNITIAKGSLLWEIRLVYYLVGEMMPFPHPSVPGVGGRDGPVVIEWGNYPWPPPAATLGRAGPTPCQVGERVLKLGV